MFSYFSAQWAKSISHHLRNPGMSRFPGTYQQTLWVPPGFLRCEARGFGNHRSGSWNGRAAHGDLPFGTKVLNVRRPGRNTSRPQGVRRPAPSLGRGRHFFALRHFLLFLLFMSIGGKKIRSSPWSDLGVSKTQGLALLNLQTGVMTMGFRRPFGRLFMVLRGCWPV